MKRVYITLDFICNNDCVMCANTDEERANNFRLSTQEVKDYLLGLALSKEDIIEFSGGEPTIRKDIIELSKFFKENLESRLVILTNARRFADEDFAEEMSKYVDQVVTAFYSPDPKIHDAVTRQEGSFEEAYAGLKNMEKRGVKISIKTMPMKQNYKQLPEFVEFAFNNFKAPLVFFSGLDLRGQAGTNQDDVGVRFSEVMPYLEQALDRAEELGQKAYIFTMPLCVIDPAYWNRYSTGMGEISKNIEFLIPGRTSQKDTGLLVEKPSEDCYECLLEQRCFWGWKGYVQRFGNSEFKSLNKGA